jgi:hypothetical protein
MGEFVGQIVLGMFETVLGRRLFWLFAAIGGFLIGWFFLDAVSDLGWWGRLTIGIVLAIALAVVAHKQLKLGIAIAGFFIFGAAAVVWFKYLGVVVETEGGRGNGAWWAIFVVAGAVAAALLTYSFDKALIALSSLTGGGATATGINNFVNIPKWSEAVIAVVLVTGGVFFQVKSMKKHGDELISVSQAGKAVTQAKKAVTRSSTTSSSGQDDSTPSS